jgi:hypothetical protein
VLRAWFLALPLTIQQWEISSLLHPCSPGRVQRFTPTSDVSIRLQITIYGFQFCWEGFSLPRGCAGLFSWGGVGWGGE